MHKAFFSRHSTKGGGKFRTDPKEQIIQRHYVRILYALETLGVPIISDDEFTFDNYCSSPAPVSSQPPQLPSQSARQPSQSAIDLTCGDSNNPISSNSSIQSSQQAPPVSSQSLIDSKRDDSENPVSVDSSMSECLQSSQLLSSQHPTQPSQQSSQQPSHQSLRQPSQQSKSLKNLPTSAGSAQPRKKSKKEKFAAFANLDLPEVNLTAWHFFDKILLEKRQLQIGQAVMKVSATTATSGNTSSTSTVAPQVSAMEISSTTSNLATMDKEIKPVKSSPMKRSPKHLDLPKQNQPKSIATPAPLVSAVKFNLPDPGVKNPKPVDLIVVHGESPKEPNNRGFFGLENLGQTCYMNSILQCLYQIESFRIYLFSGSSAFFAEISDQLPKDLRKDQTKFRSQCNTLFQLRKFFLEVSKDKTPRKVFSPVLLHRVIAVSYYNVFINL